MPLIGNIFAHGGMLFFTIIVDFILVMSAIWGNFAKNWI